VIITGDTATIYLHSELAYGHTYYVTADPTVFAAAGFSGVSDPNTWRFTTTRHRPGRNAKVISVDSRGRGDFCTVQGAINAVPAGNTVPRLIKVAAGTYTELDWVAPSKPLITVEGQSRSGTVIQYANNNTLNSANTTDVCGGALAVCWRRRRRNNARHGAGLLGEPGLLGSGVRCQHHGRGDGSGRG
jgi:Pectinesterase